MPYLICEDCSLTTYSAALWSSTDECPHCGAALPVARRALAVSLARDAGLLEATPTWEEKREPAGRRERDDD